MQNDPFLLKDPILIIFRTIPLRQDSERKDCRQRSMIPSENINKGSKNLELITFAMGIHTTISIQTAAVSESGV